MIRKNLFAFLIFSFICCLSCMGNAWAQGGSRYSVDEECDTCESEFTEDGDSGAYGVQNESQGGLFYEEDLGVFGSNDDVSSGDELVHSEPSHDSTLGGESDDSIKAKLSWFMDDDWRRGMDIRLNVGMGGILADIKDVKKFAESLVGSTVTDWAMDKYNLEEEMRLFGGDIGVTLGYRWLYGGIYFQAAFIPFHLGDSTMTMWDFNLLGKFFIPIGNKFELTLDVGIGMDTLFFGHIYAGVGGNWHIGNWMVGVEVMYQFGTNLIAVWLSKNIYHAIMPSVVAGYTF